MTWSQCMTSGHTVGITLATNGNTESVSATDTAEYLNRAPIPLADLCTNVNVNAIATEQITAATGCMAYEFSCALLSEAEEARRQAEEEKHRQQRAFEEALQQAEEQRLCQLQACYKQYGICLLQNRVYYIVISYCVIMLLFQCTIH